MKRILTAFLLVGLAIEAGAQTWYDALTLAENDYLGTARSVGMGNAMTAVGGDLGSLTFNPAGAAVAGYSQFTITPGVSIASVFGQGTYVGGSPYGFEDGIKTRSGRFQMPNFGAMVVYDTKNRTGLRRVTFGLVGNMTRDFNNRLRATGTNTETTMAGAFASLADGYPESVLQRDYFDNDIPSWNTLVGYKSGIIDPVPGREGTYLGLTEILTDKDIRLADRIGQYYNLTRRGNKYDLLMNFAMDFSDRFYVGANLGITTISYTDDATLSEEALEGGQYRDGFRSIRFRDVVQDEASGIYAKLGFIARPFAGLRIGAAIQTPTLFEVRENYGKEGNSVASTNFSTSADDVWYYNFKTPFRFNAGLAYTIGKVAMLSADYEMCDYSAMLYRPTYDDYITDFTDVNRDIQDFTGASHMIRVGGELKPVPEMAIRVGYNYATSPEIGAKTGRQSVSFGLGYSSAGSFFADFAVRFQYLPDELITPYYYYSWDDAGTYIDESILTPEICSQASLCNALVTLGWRF